MSAHNKHFKWRRIRVNNLLTHTQARTPVNDARHQSVWSLGLLCSPVFFRSLHSHTHTHTHTHMHRGVWSYSHWVYVCEGTNEREVARSREGRTHIRRVVVVVVYMLVNFVCNKILSYEIFITCEQTYSDIRWWCMGKVRCGTFAHLVPVWDSGFENIALVARNFHYRIYSPRANV